MKAPKITKLPARLSEINCVEPWESFSVPRDSLRLECSFVGEPVPHISWKRNGGVVPPNCQSSNRKGHGILNCFDFEVQPDFCEFVKHISNSSCGAFCFTPTSSWFQEAHQGSYTCYAENSRGADESQPPAVAKCKNEIICRSDAFKTVDQEGIKHCLSCFCSGKSQECHGIESTVRLIEYDFPFEEIEVFVNEKGNVTFLPTQDAIHPGVNKYFLLRFITKILFKFPIFQTAFAKLISISFPTYSFFFLRPNTNQLDSLIVQYLKETWKDILSSSLMGGTCGCLSTTENANSSPTPLTSSFEWESKTFSSVEVKIQIIDKLFN